VNIDPRAVNMQLQRAVPSVATSTVACLVACLACACGGAVATQPTAPPLPPATPIAAGDTASACGAAWLAAPAVDASLAPPPEGGAVIAHVTATGVQTYTCARGADGATSWTPSGPDADLSDCNGARAGRHFASQAGAAAPEWQATDGSYVVAQKAAATPAPGDPNAVPWLLLRVTDHGGAGAISRARYVQRVRTHGGVAPTTACDAGAVARVPYSADYYFVGAAQ
jgi:hypothetical protein